jgi:hypothetical protein
MEVKTYAINTPKRSVESAKTFIVIMSLWCGAPPDAHLPPERHPRKIRAQSNVRKGVLGEKQDRVGQREATDRAVLAVDVTKHASIRELASLSFVAIKHRLAAELSLHLGLDVGHLLIAPASQLPCKRVVLVLLCRCC